MLLTHYNKKIGLVIECIYGQFELKTGEIAVIINTNPAHFTIVGNSGAIYVNYFNYFKIIDKPLSIFKQWVIENKGQEFIEHDTASPNHLEIEAHKWIGIINKEKSDLSGGKIVDINLDVNVNREDYVGFINSKPVFCKLNTEDNLNIYSCKYNISSDSYEKIMLLTHYNKKIGLVIECIYGQFELKTGEIAVIINTNPAHFTIVGNSGAIYVNYFNYFKIIDKPLSIFKQWVIENKGQEFIEHDTAIPNHLEIEAHKWIGIINKEKNKKFDP